MDTTTVCLVSMQKKISNGGPTCSKEVADFTGYHFSECGKPAKWDVGRYGFRCGLHAKGRFFEKIRQPLSSDNLSTKPT